MRITNLLHYTEHHRFYVYRDFTLGGLDESVLVQMYQPMVGAYAIALYLTLYRELPADAVGYSGLEQQRKLFLTLELEPGEKGRRYLIEQTSKLEAVGLMQTVRKYIPGNDEYVFGYELQRPLSPAEFFRNHHLTLLLRDKIGKYAVLALRERFRTRPPEELDGPDVVTEQLSVPFYDLFRLNTKVIDLELEQAFDEASAAQQTGRAPLPDTAAKSYRYEDIVSRVPRSSKNRPFVEALKHRPDQLAGINMVARKYRLTLQETCRLLDEDGMFTDDGELELDKFQYRASLCYHQERQRDQARERKFARADESGNEPELRPEKPVEMEFYLDVPEALRGECDIHQYNLMLRNEPYTLVLDRFFRKGKVPDYLLKLFEKIDLNYKLNAEVINVLIHYLLVRKDASWTTNYIETIVSNLLAKGVDSYEQAVLYFRGELERRAGGRARADGGEARPEGAKRRGGAGSGAGRKPKLAVVDPSQVEGQTTLSEEERERIRRLALKRDGKLAE